MTPNGRSPSPSSQRNEESPSSIAGGALPEEGGEGEGEGFSSQNPSRACREPTRMPRPTGGRGERTPFQVDRLSRRDVERGFRRPEDVLLCVGELNRLWGERAGDEGAYISESWVASAGAVRGEKSCRMLSHCVAVVCRQECRETRTGDDDEIGL